jgi:hypothetical protein
MSAWHIFSAMGFYPVTPASELYALGTPVFDEVKLHLENGKTFTITAKNLTAKNYYVQGMQLNGNTHNKTFINMEDIEQGGNMVFDMSPVPNYKRGVNEGEMPVSMLDDTRFVPAPYFEMSSNKIKESLTVVMKDIDKEASVFYNIQPDGQKAGPWTKYTKPFVLGKAALVKYYAEKENNKSRQASQQFYKVVTDRTISVKSKVHAMYTAGGPEALIDGIVGTGNWKTGEWQSYYDQDFEAVVAFKQPKKITYAGVHVLQDASPWILFPSKVEFEISNNGKDFLPLFTKANEFPAEDKPAIVQTIGSDVQTTARFVRIKIKSGGKLPAWHESAGYPSHLFIDEIIIK